MCPNPSHGKYLLLNDSHFQGAIPQIFERTKETFFSNIIGIMKEAADIVYEMIKEIPCLTCPHKPQGSMVVLVMIVKYILCGTHWIGRYTNRVKLKLLVTNFYNKQVKLNLSTLEGIDDDIQFCLKLAKEESVIVLPGKNN